MIPIMDLRRQYQLLKAELEPAVLSVLEKGAFILGPEVQQFEREIAAYLGAGHALGVASGTDALYIGLRALNVGPGDEVITTAFSYIATSEAIVRTGAKPVFVELDPTTYNLDVSKIEEKITPQTRALLPVHLYGQPVDMDALMALAKKHNLAVVEDCAQSMGTEWKGQKVGTFGDVGCFSFFPTKNLGCYGDGGLVSTNSPELADKMKRLRAHGSATKYNHELPGGVNSRLDEVQAAVLRIKLRYIDQWNEQRRAVAAQYTERLSKIAGITTPRVIEGGQHVFHQYTIRVDKQHIQRDALQEALKERDIMAMIYYPIPLHLQGAHRELGYTLGDLPITEAVSEEVLSLPIYPELTSEEIQQVCDALAAVLEQTPQCV
jgi:dTDP-4-amino-4,6-dideoxygalactose transaminase